MRLTIGQLAAKVANVGATSRTKIYRKATGKWEPVASEEKATNKNDSTDGPSIEDDHGKGGMDTGKVYRKNEMEIQMLSAPLYKQVFRNTVPRTCEIDAINR